MSCDTLTEEELCFFKAFGYLLKRAVLPKDACEDAIDRMWQTAPPGVRRADPATWKPVRNEDASEDPLLIHQGTRWQYRSDGTRKWLLDLAYNDTIVGWAEQLLGRDTLRPPTVDGLPMGSYGPAWPGGPTDPQLTEGVRGIYATLPTDESDPQRHLHTDGHPFHLGVTCLLESNPPGGGAFTVWPGSHRRFYPLFQMQYDQARLPYYDHMPSLKGILHPESYLDEVQRVEADTDPVECFGDAGDIVFWHHRLGHMAGHNTATPPTIRQALLFDFCKKDLDQMRLDPPQENMWRDWGDEIQAADVPVSRQFAAEQRLPVSLAELLP